MQYVNLVLFAGLAGVCLVAARRHRTAAAAWAAATFGVLGFVVLVGAIVPDEPDDVPILLTKLLILGILAYPYALYRFSAALEPLPRRLDLVVNAATVGLAAATAIVPEFPEEGEDRPGWFVLYTLVFLVYWVGIGVIVGRRLWSAGRGLPTVARYRMRTLGAGAIGLAVALLPGALEDPPAALELVSQFLPAIAAVLFYVGFAPPAALRTVWRRPEQAKLRSIELSLVAADSRERVLDTVLPHVAALVGGASATFVDDGAADPDADQSDDVITMPVRGGRLVVAAGPYSPFFGQDELEMVRSLARFLDLVLERTTLLERERAARDAAERTSTELETLVYGISHDLKSPVISLLGYLEYLRDDHGEAIGQDGLHFIERMEKSALYMQDLLTDLLELSRVGRVAVDPTDVDLGVLVSDVRVDLLAKFPDARVEVSDLPTVHMNAARARQLFTNLIENAARHGGRPDVTVRVFSAHRDDGSAVVSVADDGVGIPAAYREKAFGIFERLAPSDTPSGTGIGLALCRKIVETTDGEIGIIDSPVGTHVRIIFPAHAVREPRRQSIEVSG
jgi:signal transduction histidine kinase